MAKKKDEIKEYFRHDYHARNHLKFKQLRMDMGLEGIGIYWCLVEMLYEEGGQIPKSHYDSIAFDLHVDKKKVIDVVENFKLFSHNSEIFFSEKVLLRLKERKIKSKKASDAIKKRWNERRKKDTSVLQPYYERNTIIGENRIEEKRIEENRIDSNNNGVVLNVDFVAAGAAPQTPVVLTIEDRKNDLYAKLTPFVDTYGKTTLRDFYEYWTEISEGQKKMRFEKEKAFDLKRRLETWKRNENKFANRNKPNTYERGKFVA
jgi:uncharacterized protein YdaU (DUF1376 family)